MHALERLADVYRSFHRFKESRNTFLLALDVLSGTTYSSKRSQSFIKARLYRKLAMLLLDNRMLKQAAQGDNLRILLARKSNIYVDTINFFKWRIIFESDDLD